MKLIILRSYVKSSLHVALSLWAFCNVLALQQGVDLTISLQCAIFGFGWFAYQYFHIIIPLIVQKQHISLSKVIILFSAIAIGLYGLVMQNSTVWLIFVFVGIITAFYALPFGVNIGLRYVPTIKVFMVALCWATLATFNLYNLTTVHFALIASKSVLWILTMIVPLEIHDLNRDVPSLKTLPQVLGVRRVKMLSYVLILSSVVLAFMTSTTYNLAWVETAMLGVLGILIFKVKKDQPKYITSFLVEAIPVSWLGLSYLVLTYC